MNVLLPVVLSLFVAIVAVPVADAWVVYDNNEPWGCWGEGVSARCNLTGKTICNGYGCWTV
jgi:hypothetical protein